VSHSYSRNEASNLWDNDPDDDQYCAQPMHRGKYTNR
jgi:hypothetical protein